MYIIVTSFEAARNVSINQEDGTEILSRDFSTTDYELLSNPTTAHYEFIKDGVVYLSVPFHCTVIMKGIEP